MKELLSYVQSLFNAIGFGPLTVVFALVLGFLSALASACCTLPLLGVLASYTAARTEQQHKVWITGMSFMGGVIAALLIIGLVVIFAGQSVQMFFGDSWKIVAGAAAILFGIGALNLFPVKLPGFAWTPSSRYIGSVAPGISGIVFGGAIALSSLPCNPGIFIILGAAVLQQHSVWAVLNLIAYALGFSIPLTAMVIGISLGKNILRLQKIEKYIRIIAGVLLIATGIYLFSIY